MSNESFEHAFPPSFWSAYRYWVRMGILLAIWPAGVCLFLARSNMPLFELFGGMVTAIVFWAAIYAWTTNFFNETLFLSHAYLPRLFLSAFLIRCFLGMTIYFEVYTGLASHKLLSVFGAGLRDESYAWYACWAILHGGLVTASIVLLTVAFATVRALVRLSWG